MKKIDLILSLSKGEVTETSGHQSAGCQSIQGRVAANRYRSPGTP